MYLNSILAFLALAHIVSATFNVDKAPQPPGSCYRYQHHLHFSKPGPNINRVVVKSNGVYKTYHIHQYATTYYLNDHEKEFFRNLKPGLFRMAFQKSNGKMSNWFRLCHKNTPIALDIDGSGAVERIQGEFYIDLAASGETTKLHEWFAPTEGILIDTSVEIFNGTITGEHLFGDMGDKFEDGFEKLEVHDGNGDNIIQGEELENIAIWVDGNSNTKVDEAELHDLSTFGIVALNTFSHDKKSYAVLQDGYFMMMEDLFFARR